MSIDVWAGALLIAVPIGFNVAFFELGRAFEYPAILRRPPDEILRRFHDGGSGLLLRWHALLLAALAMAPLAVLLAVALGGSETLVLLSIVIGTLAALVQALGLARWTFAVPELARRYVDAEGPTADAVRATVETVFTTLHRYMGVGLGEHLGYLLTGAWTLLVGAAILTGGALTAWIGWLGLPIGVALLVGSLEFVGPNEPHGWSFAERLVPIAYVAWSIWLIVVGAALIL